MFSILHISDLHRSDVEPISNETLTASLMADCDRFAAETPPIRQPDALVVSGDVVSGASLETTNFDSVLEEQFELADEFLGALTERLFNGDRSRVVIVPGNHDCCWNTALNAMVLVAEEEVEEDLLRKLESPGSDLRWNWRERRLYRVVDPASYAHRLGKYWDFVERFYAGVPLKFPVQRGRGFNLFELDSGRVLVAALNSLHGNDCFSFQASFGPKAIARAALEIRDQRVPYNLLMAVWHHGLHSRPSYRSDYVSIDEIYELIGHGFRLGLHGHQHFAEIGSHYVHASGERRMAVVSAGSLCAGANDLPRGINRQYNVVVVSDDYAEVEVHVREMTRGNHFAASTAASGFADGVARLRLAPDSGDSGAGVRIDSARRDELVLAAEASLRSGAPDAALEHLELVEDDWEDPYVRTLLLRAAEESGRWEVLVAVLADPRTPDELIKLVEGLMELGRTEEAVSALNRPDGPSLADHVRREISRRLERHTALGRRRE